MRCLENAKTRAKRQNFHTIELEGEMLCQANLKEAEDIEHKMLVCPRLKNDRDFVTKHEEYPFTVGNFMDSIIASEEIFVEIGYLAVSVIFFEASCTPVRFSGIRKMSPSISL